MSYFEREAKAQRANNVSINEISRTLNCEPERIKRALRGDHVVRVVLGYNMVEVFAFIDSIPGESTLQLHRKSGGTICLDLLPPEDQDSKEWATRQANALCQEFNAVRAPRWAE